MNALSYIASPPPLRQPVLHRQRLQNVLHTILILGTCFGLFAWIGSCFGGWPVILIFTGMALTSVWLSGRLSPYFILRSYGANVLSPTGAPSLYRLLHPLCRHAGLDQLPPLSLIPTEVPLAFTVGSGRHAHIVLSRGMTRLLDANELQSVLAHELAHIRHGDTFLMSLCDAVTRLMHFLSTFAGFLLLLNFPFILSGQILVPWSTLAILLFAPQLMPLLQLALSRTREFNADLAAAHWTGHPHTFIRALRKIEDYFSPRSNFFLPGRHREHVPSLLRTHPPTEQRIGRLEELVDQHPDHHSDYDWIFNLNPKTNRTFNRKEPDYEQRTHSRLLA